MTRIIRALAVLAAAIAAAAVADAVKISGRIVSCPACRLNALPEVKKFVKGGADIGAIGYEGVEVEYVRGAPPVLTIFHDLVEAEKVDLSTYKFDELHKMMVEKGFVKKPEAEKSGVIVKPPVLVPPVPTDPAITVAAEHRTEDGPPKIRMKREDALLRRREETDRLRHREGNEDPLRHPDEKHPFSHDFRSKGGSSRLRPPPATPVVKVEDMARLDFLVVSAEAKNAAAAKKRELRTGMVLAVVVAWALALAMFVIIGLRRCCGKGGMTFADRRRVVFSLPFVIGGTYVLLAYV